MKTLLVDCSLKPTLNNDLHKVAEKFGECIVVHFTNIKSTQKVRDLDSVILSGSAARIVKPSDRWQFKGTVDLIKTCNLPMLGICFGHQLLSWTFGAKVGSLDEPVLGRFENVRLINVDDIFAGFKEQQTLPLAENHYDYVIKESLSQNEWVLLADSVSCDVEAVRLKNRPVYGLQFHPERLKIKNVSHSEGHKIIENFFSNVVKR